MTKLSSGILYLQKDSIFASQYSKGCPKNTYWEHTYEDALNILAKLPEMCAHIYKNTYDKPNIETPNAHLDYSGYFGNLMGYHNPEFHELMRLYLLVHSDHEGGNASAHTCRVVGSTLADPYLSLCSSMNALAGPLHGLANQNVLKWLLNMRDTIKSQGKQLLKKQLKNILGIH